LFFHGKDENEGKKYYLGGICFENSTKIIYNLEGIKVPFPT